MTEQFTFFWGGSFSQWHKSDFTVDGKKYVTAEQYMMEQKALLFDDQDIADEIMKTNNPKKQKTLGRKVANFDPEKWNEEAKAIVYKGNYAKFTQSESLLTELLDSYGTTLVEASPYDKIWGIGLAEDDVRALDRSTWKGSNWLGEVLTNVRDDLSNILNEESYNK